MNSKIKRRIFLKSSAYWGIGSYTLLQNTHAFAQDGANLSAIQREALRQRLHDYDDDYDPEEKMVVTNVSGVGYHTTLKSGKVHNTRSSLQYATALLDSGEEWRLTRACEIIQKLISLQDQNLDNKTYGIWSWYLEEPLGQMSPPDWNWADFCGTQLLQAWIDHRGRLPDKLRDELRESILHAARSIKRRNVGMGYTNIAIMGTYVTLATAEYIGDEEIETYAKDRLRRFHSYTMDQGTFTEYNSPTYSIVALTEISRMLMHIRDEDDLKLIRDLHDLAWSHIARHFHAPTHQWAGPHSRWYGEVLRGGNSTHAFLEMGLNTPGWLMPKDQVADHLRHYRIAIDCPEKYHHYFNSLNEPRFEVETFRKRRSGGRQPVVGSTYLHPQYTLGAINQGDFWNQRRPILAYWGTPEQPAYMRMRFLHDGYDYCSALFFSQQQNGRALIAIPFATDYGDTHVSLDRIQNATIEAEDMRLRFEFGGSIEGLEIAKPTGMQSPISLQERNIGIQIFPITNQFGEHELKWEAGKENGIQYLDLVAYHGDSRKINFNELKEAHFSFAISIDLDKANMDPNKIEKTKKDSQLNLSWNNLQFSIPTNPMKKGELEQSFTPKT